jgi:hypothetical protein
MGTLLYVLGCVVLYNAGFFFLRDKGELFLYYGGATLGVLSVLAKVVMNEMGH